MAHKKAGGSSRNGRDSQSKRLGVKVTAASSSLPADHRAAARHQVHAGDNVGIGRDHTLFAKVDGRSSSAPGPAGEANRERAPGQ